MNKKQKLKLDYKMLYKSINWWEGELNNLLDFFENYGSINTPKIKRLKKQNQKLYQMFVNRGSMEMETLDKLEEEIKNYQENEKKEKEE